MPYEYNEEISSYFIERRTRSKTDSMVGTHYHSHYEIYYLIKGNARYFIDNIIFDLSAGDMVLIPPYVIHRAVYVEDEILERILINFTPDFIEKREDNNLFKCFKRHYVKNTDIPKYLISYIEKENNSPDEFSDELIKNHLINLLAYLSRNAEKPVFHTNTPTFIQQIADYITENYYTEITLDELSKQFSVSKSHLSRQFKNATGFGICEYITTVRVRNAERLIMNTDLSITEIATKCGFNDSNYFSLVFKKLKGASPLKFKTAQLL